MKVHYVRWRSGGALVACGYKGAFIRSEDGTFNCKNCLRVVSSKSWQMMINGEETKFKYREK